MEGISCLTIEQATSKVRRLKDNTEKPLLAIKVCSIILICALGISISMAIRGAQFYRLVDSTDGKGMVYGGRGIEPYCRAILHDAHFPLQVKLGEFSVGGGTIYDAGQLSGGVEVGMSLSDGVQQQVDRISYQNYSSLDHDECQTLAILPHQNESGLFLFMDMHVHKQLTLRNECGGGTGSWEAADGDGVWAGPLVICFACWFLLRMAGCFLDWNRFGGSGSRLSQIGTQVCKYMILTVGASVAIAPILNMEQTDGCEQLLTSLYSGRMQIVVMAGLVPLVLAVSRVVWLVHKKDDDPDDETSVKLNLGKRFKSNFKKCLFLKQSDSPCWRNWLKALVPTILIAATLVLLLLQLWTIYTLSWEFSWGFLFDWHWTWPKIELTGKITAFQVLAKCLWLLDTVGVVTDSLSKADTALESAKNVVDDVADSVRPQHSAQNAV